MHLGDKPCGSGDRSQISFIYVFTAGFIILGNIYFNPKVGLW